eukprot:scaffold54076_cov44-Prasinocladus_malaysianus.AAC.2
MSFPPLFYQSEVLPLNSRAATGRKKRAHSAVAYYDYHERQWPYEYGFNLAGIFGPKPLSNLAAAGVTSRYRCTALSSHRQHLQFYSGGCSLPTHFVMRWANCAVV